MSLGNHLRRATAFMLALSFAVDAAAQLWTIANSPTGLSLSVINGRKAIVTSSGLHVVFSDSVNVKYSSSPDGSPASWSAPVTVAAVATYPVIASAGGTIGIAFVQGSWIRYQYRQSNGSWSTTYKIAPAGTELSMVGYGNRMHLTWNGSTVAMYTSFPATSPGNPNSEMVSLLPLCGTTAVFKPTIAVAAPPGSAAAPIVRIAYLYKSWGASGCPHSASIDLQVSEKRPGMSAFNWNSFNGTLSIVINSPSSISMAAIPGTGEFYLLISGVGNAGIATTDLLYQNAWGTGAWKRYQIAPRWTLADVAVDCGRFRIAVSDFALGGGGYGPTWYRTGTWWGTGAPQWEESGNVQVSTTGRDPQALFFRSKATVSTWREIHCVIEERAGANSHLVRHDAHATPPPPANNC